MIPAYHSPYLQEKGPTSLQIPRTGPGLWLLLTVSHHYDNTTAIDPFTKAIYVHTTVVITPRLNTVLMFYSEF